MWSEQIVNAALHRPPSVAPRDHFDYAFHSLDLRSVETIAAAKDNSLVLASRRLRSVSVKEILAATARHHGVRVSQYTAFRSQAAGRDMAA